MTTASPMLERARDMEDTLIEWRRDIHMHPELSFQEFRTANLVADTLREMGLEVETGVGKTGVVARIGEGRPAIGIRADMDALPLQEMNDVVYKSQTPGVMHACGHDAHTAILLGVARLLNNMEDRPAGEIRLLFQPSEEDEDSDHKSGAVRMIEEGALEELDAVIALHVNSNIPAGQIRVATGPNSASVDSFNATIIGEGCHGAYPHQGVDPVFILAQVINAIHGIRARRINPVRPAVISIGAVHGGSANNVIPDEITLNGTIRSYDDDTREQLWAELEQAFKVTQAFGGDYKLEIIKSYPSQHNDAEVAQLIRSIGVSMLGEDGLYPEEPGMGAEDFAYMTRKAPGAMFSLGAKFDEVNRPHHSPIFDLDESSFAIGAAILAEAAAQLLKSKA
ncbi:MAG: amidohydrolase [Chloroflexi bacterium]|nr:amidohydrolase [Chloroflexota bacterium]